MKLLLTGFEPFGGEAVNPALEAVRRIPCRVGGLEIIPLEVPVVFGKSIQVVTAAMDAHRPQAVLCVGQAGGRPQITPERVAINVDDTASPDNEGNKPVDRPIVPGGPAAYFSTLPVKAMVEAVRAAGLPASLSNSAGTYVCNHLMYGVLHHIATKMPGVPGGFLHVPYSMEQVVERAAPAMSLADIARAIEAMIGAIEESLKEPQPLK